MTVQEVKGTLAKLLATENLVVEHKAVSTASFDVHRRVLTLPIWNAKEIVFNLLVAHEVGHALFTPDDDIICNLPCPKSYVNVTEDARIEKLMKRKFAGISKDFYGGYKQLHEDDFFSVKDINVESLKLIDRINLYFKLGANALMPFSPEEIPLRDAVAEAETFEDAIDAAVAIKNFEGAQKDQQKIDDLPEVDNQSGGGHESQEAQDQQPTEEGEGDQEESNDSQGGSEEADLDTPSYQKDSDEEAMTDQSLSEALQDIATEHSYNETRYIEIPNVDLKHIVIDPKTINDMSNEYWSNWSSPLAPTEVLDWTVADQNYNNFKRDCTREVSYLQKEFEMKKSAASYARESISKTGVLDTTKLHQYRYNEDLFKKVTIRPDGKNHGLIFLLDWSGSMAEIIHDTFKQLLSLCLFCRKSGIPFSVYSFVSDASYGHIRDYDEHVGKENDFYIPKHFHLCELLNSDLNNSVFDRYARDLYRVTQMYDQRYGNHRNPFASRPVPDAIPNHLHLGGTPLNEAIACLQTVIPQFSSKNGVEKCHVTILSDGESNWSGYWTKSSYDDRIHRSCMNHNESIRCRKTGRTYNRPNWGNYLTETLLRYMKGRFPQCNFTGFRLGSARDLNYILGHFNSMTDLQKKNVTAIFKKHKSVSAPIMGYQELYLIQSNKLNDDVEFDVAEDATKAAITRAFKKTLKAKANNKKILSSFITQIA
tara:strand:- start:6023 stop:8146 length:2124 start_codon:yes stop_codon:yes gene_type:complete